MDLPTLAAARSHPAIVGVTSAPDARVVPATPLGSRPPCRRPEAASIPIRAETEAGHGPGAPTRKRIGESTDVLNLLERLLGITADPPSSLARPST